MNKTMSILRLAIFIALAFTFSCSSDDKDDGGSSNSSGGSSSPSSGGGIVNADNEAWLKGYGMIFKQNGELIYINEYNGNWCIEFIAIYSIRGNQITVCYESNDCEEISYSISGRTLDLYKEGGHGVFTRTSGVYVNGNCPKSDK